MSEIKRRPIKPGNLLMTRSEFLELEAFRRGYSLVKCKETIAAVMLEHPSLDWNIRKSYQEWRELLPGGAADPPCDADNAASRTSP